MLFSTSCQCFYSFCHIWLSNLGGRRRSYSSTAGDDRRGVGVNLWLGLYALLCHQLYVHRPRRCCCLSRWGFLISAARGQATLGGLGVALVCLFIPWPHWSLALCAAIVSSALFAALWAAIPAWLQAKRGSHIVITTIMFNFIAASLLNYILVNQLRPKGSMDPASARFPKLPTFLALTKFWACLAFLFRVKHQLISALSLR